MEQRDYALMRFIDEGFGSSPGSLFPAINGFTAEPPRYSFNGFGSVSQLLGLPMVIEPLPLAYSYSNNEGSAMADSYQFQRNNLQMLQQNSIKEEGGYEDEDEGEPVKIPKPEPVDDGWIAESSLFEAAVTTLNRALVQSSSPSAANSDESSFYQLPDLNSLEKVPANNVYSSNDSTINEPSFKRFRSSSSSTSPVHHHSYNTTLEANLPLPLPAASNPSSKIPLAIPLKPSSSSSYSAGNGGNGGGAPYARERRQKIGDRIRCLQRLMPWDKKMDMATLLEESYKYIKFLQAQVSVLQAMPFQSSFNTTTTAGTGNVGGGGLLEKLNRQQLLEVLMNSPVAQTILYSSGCCVYSLEQLVLMRKNIVTSPAEKVFLQQMMVMLLGSS